MRKLMTVMVMALLLGGGVALAKPGPDHPNDKCPPGWAKQGVCTPTTTTEPPTTTTTVPPTSTTTTTTTIPPVGGGVVWTCDYEDGTTDCWNARNGGGIWSSGNYSHEVVQFDGDYAHRITLNDGAVRLTYQGRHIHDILDFDNVPTEVFSSAMRFFPRNEQMGYWNTWQYKQRAWDGSGASKKLYSINVYDAPDGQMYYFINTRINPATGIWQAQNIDLMDTMSSVPIPVGVWHHMEARYVWSQTGDGSLTVWQDGVQIIDMQNITTEQDWPYNKWHREWILNSAGQSWVNPPNVSYVDDVVVATERQGSG